MFGDTRHVRRNSRSRSQLAQCAPAATRHTLVIARVVVGNPPAVDRRPGVELLLMARGSSPLGLVHLAHYTAQCATTDRLGSTAFTVQRDGAGAHKRRRCGTNRRRSLWSWKSRSHFLRLKHEPVFIKRFSICSFYTACVADTASNVRARVGAGGLARARVPKQALQQEVSSSGGSGGDVLCSFSESKQRLHAQQPIPLMRYRALPPSWLPDELSCACDRCTPGVRATHRPGHRSTGYLALTRRGETMQAEQAS